MAIKELTKVYQTEDGKLHATLEAAQAYEAAEKMLWAIKQAQINASFDDFGRTSQPRFAKRMAEELIRAGFTYNPTISYGA
jgi:hypothetical protein